GASGDCDGRDVPSRGSPGRAGRRAESHTPCPVDRRPWNVSRPRSPQAGRELPLHRAGARARLGGYCLRYGRPLAAGGIDRPITPTTAISVKTYGSAWKRTEGLGHGSARRNDSAVEKPNRSAAAKAPKGRQLPKISAARPMKPRPAVMFSLKEPRNPIERYAPPSAASIPDTITAA